MQLNTGQQRAYDAIIYKKKNVFLTGIAGVGKSLLVKKIYEDSCEYYNVGLCALTGIAALLIDGVTIHSYLGIGLGESSVDTLYRKITNWKFMLNRWSRLDFLIIDEISMMSPELFEKLEELARRIRNNNMPFGGIRLLLVGDFLQLMPVKNDRFVFESPKWAECINTTEYLTQIMRQNDYDFIKALSEIRIGAISDESKKLIESREIRPIIKNGIQPTKIFAVNREVDATNQKYYNQLDTTEYTYDISYKWMSKPNRNYLKNKEKYEAEVQLPYKVKLKVGAQVMYLVNQNDLVNGSRGVVVDFIENLPIVRFRNGKEVIVERATLTIEENDDVVCEYSQIPLKLAYAVSCHKCQGSTLDYAMIDLKDVFCDGQFYVALSRVSTLSGLFVKNINWDRVLVNPKAKAFYDNISYHL